MSILNRKKTFLIQDDNQLNRLRIAGNKLKEVFAFIETKIIKGISLDEIDLEIEKKILELKAKNCLKGYRPHFSKTLYPSSSCLSVNDVIVHGIPKNNFYQLKEGDIITVDIVLEYEGFFVDAARTFPVGQISSQDQELLNATKGALKEVVKNFSKFKRVGDISKTIEQYIKDRNFCIIKELGGHGCGFAIHTDPFIPNFFSKRNNQKLIAGSIICVEPIVAISSNEIVLDKDGFTIKTKNGKNSAHFEHTLFIKENDCEIIV